MNIKEFVKKRYRLVRESEAFLISLLIHALIMVAMTFIVITGTEKVTSIIKVIKRQKDVAKPPPPKPMVLPKNVQITPPPPKAEQLQKLDDRMVVKKKLDKKLKPKALTLKRKTKIEYKQVRNLGKSIRTRMNTDYANKFGVQGYGATLQAVIEQFVVVKYEGGDWDCEFFHKGREPVMTLGSIPNLITEIERRTNIKVEKKVPVVVRADSPEIHDSPFVYFTGHVNFTLTEAEVENLRTYIIQGGAIVANSALPGRRSRFDIAFRREMKRIMPTYELQPINERHEIYKSFPGHSFPQVPPEGMNYWREPIEVIDIDGRIAVIYNLNDYGEMMLATLDQTGNAIKRGESAAQPGYWFEGHLIHHNHNRIFANVDDFPTILDAYMMNINILAYILTR